MDYRQFRREALILKGLRHPGIPIVYDLEEDEQYSYLIEEFLEGNSLYALVSDMGHFSKAMTIRYGIQICRLVNILHSARPNPILYLDLQPKNLLVCHDTIKLIDFDHAIHLCEAEHLTMRYGTVGCAAPEQYSGDVLDERTDIYAIGAVLHYMLTGQYPEQESGHRALQLPDMAERRLMRIIRTCLQKEKKRRFQSAEELGRELKRLEEQIQKKTERKGQGICGRNQISSLTIAVAGSRRGAGCTHAAIGLTAYLCWNGVRAVYEERNESGAVRQLAVCRGTDANRFGIYQIGGIPMYPLYGGNVKLDNPAYQVRVLDYGTCWQQLLQEPADMCLLICGAKPWEKESTYNAIQSFKNRLGLAVIYNQFCGQLKWKLPSPAGGTTCFLMPSYSNPFVCTDASQRFYGALWDLWFEEVKGGILRRLYGKIRGFVARVFWKRTGEPWE